MRRGRHARRALEGATVYFADFKKLALMTLLGQQLDNGSWFNAPVSTVSAVEVLCEDISGPDFVCRSSKLQRKIHPDATDGRFQLWPWRKLGECSTDESKIFYAAALRGLWSRSVFVFSTDPLDQSRAWATAKFLRLSAVADPDYQLGAEDVYERLMHFETREPWLIAQIALAALHSDLSWGFYGEPGATVEFDFVHRAHGILKLMGADHWTGFTITPEEATAIVGTFVFHDCLLYLWKSQEPSFDIYPYRDRALAWLLARQSDLGSWANSAHVTAQCLIFLDTLLSSSRAVNLPMAVIVAAIRKGMDYLLSPDIQAHWVELDKYQDMNILTALIRLSKRTGPVSAAFEALDIDGSRFGPDVFISYGGPDASFARRLAIDFEASGLRVWFAEWDVDYGDDVVQEIENGMSVAKKFVIVLSPEAIRRPWVKKELSAAFNQALSGSGRLIIPVMRHQTEPPPFLAAHRWVDFTDDREYRARISELVRRLKGRKLPRI
jgi:hypothetical protein